jgi:hypothetical protein
MSDARESAEKIRAFVARERAKLEGVREGPWEGHGWQWQDGNGHWHECLPSVISVSSHPICEAEKDKGQGVAVKTREIDSRNMVFIASARTTVPALLDCLELVLEEWDDWLALGTDVSDMDRGGTKALTRIISALAESLGKGEG